MHGIIGEILGGSFRGKLLRLSVCWRISFLFLYISILSNLSKLFCWTVGKVCTCAVIARLNNYSREICFCSRLVYSVSFDRITV